MCLDHASCLTPPKVCEVPDLHDRAAAATEWAALSGLLAGRNTARLSTNGGKDYLTRNVRRIRKSIPRHPAAVHLYDGKGRARVLALDFDTARGDVTADYAAATRLLTEHHVDYIADCSPSGGRHIYIPLDFNSQRRYQPELYALTRRFQSIFSSIDAQPHANAATGCIRPPGSPWKKSGYQRLLTDFKAAVYIATTGNTTTHLESLFAALPATPHPSQPLQEAEDTISDEAAVWMPHVHRYLSPRLSQIARTGLYDTNRYPSASEARMAVLLGCARAGLTTEDVRNRIETGTWPGLAALYGEEAENRYHRLFCREYRKAQHFLRAAPPSEHALESVHSVTTSPKQVTGGAAPSLPSLPSSHAELRIIEAHLAQTEAHRYTGNTGQKKRLLLRSLIAASHQTDSLTIAFGIRSLSLGSGIHHTQIPHLLRELCAEDDPYIRLVSPARGRLAAHYELLPRAGEHNPTPWRRTQPVHGLRPAFRELGISAALVYESLELHSHQSGRGIARRTGLHVSAVHEALHTLLAYNLIESTHTAGNELWQTTGPERLTQVAEELGCIEAFDRRVSHYRLERRVWWQWLSVRRNAAAIGGEYIDHDDPAWIWPTAPPPEAA